VQILRQCLRSDQPQTPIPATKKKRGGTVDRLTPYKVRDLYVALSPATAEGMVGFFSSCEGRLLRGPISPTGPPPPQGSAAGLEGGHLSDGAEQPSKHQTSLYRAPEAVGGWEQQ